LVREGLSFVPGGERLGGLGQAAASEYASEGMTPNTRVADAVQGISALLEKRPARWVGQEVGS
jgi:hypothetical protein